MALLETMEKAVEYRQKLINTRTEENSKSVLDINEEKLAMELYWLEGFNSNPQKKELAWKICRNKLDYIDTAKHLSKNATSFLSIKKED